MKLKLKCIDDRECSYISLNNVYDGKIHLTIINCYIVKADDDNMYTYPKYIFKDVTRKLKLKKLL